jgi:RNA 3'-terminal phosphate cyclase
MPDNNNSNQSITLVNIESLINSHDSRLKTLTDEMKTHKEMLNNLLENDNEYVEAAKEASKFAKLKTISKKRVMASEAAKSVVEKLQDSQSQLKELRVALSDYLAQYVTLAGTNQFEGADGILRQIIYTAKLVKKNE